MIRLLAIPLVFIALLAGAMAWSGGGVEKRADLVYLDRGDVYTLDLNQISYMQDFRTCYGIREGLASPDPVTFLPVMAGATKYEVSDSKLIWTFHLRPEARWTNGDLVTARDYLFSYRRMLEDPGEYTYLFYYFKNALAYQEAYAEFKPANIADVGIEAVDDLTLKLTLDNPVPYLLELMAFPVFYPRNERSMEPFKEVQPNGHYTYKAEYTRPSPREGVPGVVTNGPFELKVWEFRKRLIYEKSPTYWDRANVRLDRIEKVVNDNALAQFLSYETGAVDWMSDVPGDLAADLHDKGRKDLRTSPAFGTSYLTLMCKDTLPADLGGGKNPLADVRVRRALAMSVDKKFIVDNITRMGELPARTYLPPDGTLPDFRWMPGLYDTTRSPDQPYDDKEIRALLVQPPQLAGPGLPYNIELARKLLAEAGYPDGQGFPVLPLLYNSDNTMRGMIVQALKNQWKSALNIDFVIQTVEGKIFKERMTQRNYAIGTVAWYGDYADASTFTEKYLSTSLQNNSNWISPTFDNLSMQARKEPDAATRGRILSQAEQMIDTESPIIPLYHYVNAYLSHDNVEGTIPNPRGLVVFKSVFVKH